MLFKLVCVNYVEIGILLVGFICMLSGLFFIKLKLCLVLFNCGEEMLRLNNILLILFIRL